MNLYDIIKRSDSCASFNPALVTFEDKRLSGTLERCVAIAPNGNLTLKNAHQIHVLRIFSRQLGWMLIPPRSGYSELAIKQVGRAGQQADLCVIRLEAQDCPRQITLNWSAWAGNKAGYDLQIVNTGSSDAVISVGPLYSARKELVACLTGNGIEIGPGANPAVKNSEYVRVKYVESMPVDQWFEVYTKKSARPESQFLWENYEVASAQKLDSFEDESLDFIFSSHVFEHLANPIGVLNNWSRKLKRGGIIAAVIPDCRYTFDLRQTPTCLDEWENEFKKDIWDLEIRHYERWCQYTEVRANIHSLLSRKYSVHAHYYTPESFMTLVHRVFDEEYLQGLTILTSINGKDFGVLLKRGA